ncbi:MAG: CBS domain-containing protein, partial [Bacteroidia bacterium]|nr:CBS domain-containing protein [Bacteroidia bacterium]
PFKLEGDCFTKVDNQLNALLKLGRKVAKENNSHILLTGILPTLKYRHLKFDYMTPIKRYQTISDILLKYRKRDFEIYLQGVDDVIMSLGSVLFEACNTSFQLHLQIHPDHFVDQYNWSQMISGPVLAAGVNSPLLFGKELWAETRIALFKQSLDTRTSKNQMRSKLPRVFFGQNWIKGNAASIWKEQIMRFPLLLTSDNFSRSTEQLKQGINPDLRSAILHNGTSYTWNRLCYGNFGATPHMRIECRYLPSGPSILDEMANFMFWIGLMKAQPENWAAQTDSLDFNATKDNFIKAARYGLDVSMNWYGKEVPVRELIQDTLLPLSISGLEKMKVDSADIKKYMGVIEGRTKCGCTGSHWMVHNYRIAKTRMNSNAALKVLTELMVEYQYENVPVHEWERLPESFYFIPSDINSQLVEDLMTTDVFTLREHNSIAIAKSILSWKSFHHIPVEDANGELIGLLTDGLIERHTEQAGFERTIVKDIMIKDFYTISSRESVGEARNLMNDKNLKGLPVVFDNKIVGIITRNDIKTSLD